ncbi:carbohydrate ABC transporter permease [Lachnoclostridium sp. Marseille-P6806]|uniref:carbohydrate ABC transporter permease n=1 Tax=Lachnoclostridium sp. Marseille-P6806 TaxID=2364793 RepID=UPI001030B15C|nr:carbohydrate ABC transporter permease [Lachnoclostridium sp. Marseille-P6806]
MEQILMRSNYSKKPHRMRKTPGEHAFGIITAIILIFCCVMVIYPIYYMFIVSISDGYAVTRGEVVLYPIGVNFKAYKIALGYSSVVRSFWNSVLYTVVGTLIAVVMTALCAYPLSRKKMFGRGMITFIVTFTMFFDSGLVANYMIVSSLHIKNTIWAMVVPGAISVWYMIIMRTFFQGIPEELYESAYLDGGNDWTIFIKIILPLSKAVIATIVLFYAVQIWNAFIPALLYLDDSNKYPMQLLLRNIVMGSNNAATGTATVAGDSAVLGKNIKYAVIFITTAPILVVYPFVQKYFVKGVMVGSIKG